MKTQHWTFSKDIQVVQCYTLIMHEKHLGLFLDKENNGRG